VIAIDSSSLIAFLGGDDGADVEAVHEALRLKLAVLPPVVLTEVLSLPGLDARVIDLLLDLPLLEVDSGYWERAGARRRRILEHRLRARLADTLIAQSCIDHGVPLITRDSDFRHFKKHSGLELVG